jgi:hypothetical protein
MNIQEEIAKLKHKIAELEEAAKGGRWTPDNDENYYYPDPTAYDFWSHHYWKGDEIDHHLQRAGMTCPTEEEAAEIGKRMYYRQWFDSLSDAPKEWVSDVWTAAYNENGKRIRIIGNFLRQACTYFASEESCRKAIDTIGEENFIKYVLGVRDGI